MGSTFTAPSWANNQPTRTGCNALFSRMDYNRVGFSVVRDATGSYTQVADADDDLVRTSTAFYMGGRTYEVTPAEVADLTAAGFGEYVQTV